MKRLTAILLLLVLLCSLAACKKETEAPAEEPTAAAEPETQAVPSDVTTLPAVEKQKPVVDGEPEEAQQETKAAAVSMELAEGETLVCDDDSLGLKIISAETNADGDYLIHIAAINKTDRTATLFIDNSVVNGYVCDPYFSAKLEPGESIDDVIYWFEDQLDDCNIDTVTQVAFRYDLYDADDFSLDSYAKGDFVYQPLGADAVNIVERAPEDDDIILLDTNELTMIVTDVDADGDWGYTLDVYLVNKTDAEIMFAIDDACINGTELDPFWAWSIPAQSRSYTDISWSSEELQEAGITEITEIALDMDAYNNDNWDMPSYVTETVTFDPRLAD